MLSPIIGLRAAICPFPNYCISENLPGVTLQDLRSEQLPPVIDPVARTLEAIAESDLQGMSGFGPFNAQGIGAYQSWRHFLTDIASSERNRWNAVDGLADRSHVLLLLKILEDLALECPEISCLVHGDFGSNNVLTNGFEVTGVIDWSEALIGDPLYDVANIFFWSTWLNCMRQQAHYFESRLGSLPELRNRLLCYQLRIGLAEVHQNVVEGNRDAAAWALSRCGELAR
jgi:hygromycin-B 4-O-kinase